MSLIKLEHPCMFVRPDDSLLSLISGNVVLELDNSEKVLLPSSEIARRLDYEQLGFILYNALPPATLHVRPGDVQGFVKYFKSLSNKRRLKLWDAMAYASRVSKVMQQPLSGLVLDAVKQVNYDEAGVPDLEE